MAVKKGTKLTDKPKDYMLRARMDAETLGLLDAMCRVKGQGRSEVVRWLIHTMCGMAILQEPEKYDIDTVMDCAAVQMQNSNYMTASALNAMAAAVAGVDEDKRHDVARGCLEAIRDSETARNEAWANYSHSAHPGAFGHSHE